MQIFLGGTCNNSTWREILIPELEELGVSYFNPVVPNWNEEAQAREEAVKADPQTIGLYVITSEMTGVFSIAEVADASNKNPSQTVFCFVEEGFEPGQIKSLQAVGRLIEKNGAVWVKEIDKVPEVLSSISKA